ncbi:Outer-membrane lipoprotein carrier protein [Candidatus Kinetoplastibacterium sorsogonicusi]|uniref:Outer-membrane lipoprotein carrier protein n=1 Tax=Candidatus Kinetoplastidibacterium kentomonadis TaxID=1576550 RepID=A0A3S7JAB4_9PROT|nr:hypothetical protein [Candidatus Kinetoplastibacterium sorsogonicusi]AWD32608.1 Outer-membrane lipoprotein carrier protein [Candidatus Kinetoplastibacterium sorsogonicusi]
MIKKLCFSIYLLVFQIFFVFAKEISDFDNYFNSIDNFKCDFIIKLNNNGNLLFQKNNKLKITTLDNIYLLDKSRFYIYDKKHNSVIVYNNFLNISDINLCNLKLNFQVTEILYDQNHISNTFRITPNNKYEHLFKYMDIIFENKKISYIDILDIFDKTIRIKIINTNNNHINEKEFSLNLSSSIDIIEM